MNRSIAAIRRRLVYLQLRSFIIVVLLSMLVIIGVMIWAVYNSINVAPLEQLPIISRLEGYYIGNGRSWEGVNEVFTQSEDFQASFWQWNSLVDNNGTVLIGPTQGSRSGSDLSNSGGFSPHSDVSIILRMDGEPIGRILFNISSFGTRLRAVGTILLPVAALAIFLGVFLIISNYYLIRRIVNPLSDTIAAANEVAAGNLKARVRVDGPDDLRGLNDTFNHMASALDEGNSNRREFLADIAHELRTPLTIMRGRLEGILDGIYPPDETHVAPILQATYLLERLVDDLRTLTLAETRQLHFDVKQVDLGSLLRNIVEVFSAQAAQNNIRLIIRIPEHPVVVRVDPQRMEQVVGNILSNSLRHVENGGSIHLLVREEDGSIRLQIEDDGPGVPEEDLKHLFDRFWRMEKSRSRQTGGSGLGLAISKQLIEAQGGNILAANRDDGGLVVTIHLPAQPQLPV